MQRHQLFLFISDTFPTKDRLSERIQTDRKPTYFSLSHHVFPSACAHCGQGQGTRIQPHLDRPVKRGSCSPAPTRMDSPRSRNDANRWEKSFTFSHIWGNKESLWWRRFAACSNTDSGTALQQYRGASRPNTDNNIKGLYGCVIEEYAL